MTLNDGSQCCASNYNAMTEQCNVYSYNKYENDSTKTCVPGEQTWEFSNSTTGEGCQCPTERLDNDGYCCPHNLDANNECTCDDSDK